MGIRILSGGGRHEFIDDWRWRDRKVDESLSLTHGPMICLHCGAETWREKGTGRIEIMDYAKHDFPRGPFMRRLTDEEKGCEFFIVKHVMET